MQDPVVPSANLGHPSVLQSLPPPCLNGAPQSSIGHPSEEVPFPNAQAITQGQQPLAYAASQFAVQQLLQAQVGQVTILQRNSSQPAQQQNPPQAKRSRNRQPSNKPQQPSNAIYVPEASSRDSSGQQAQTGRRDCPTRTASQQPEPSHLHTLSRLAPSTGSVNPIHIQHQPQRHQQQQQQQQQRQPQQAQHIGGKTNVITGKSRAEKTHTPSSVKGRAAPRAAAGAPTRATYKGSMPTEVYRNRMTKSALSFKEDPFEGLLDEVVGNGVRIKGTRWVLACNP
eukprot:1176820-Prorocentrum_minimum.AAC.13